MLRFSSTHEPSDPPPRIVLDFIVLRDIGRHPPGGGGRPGATKSVQHGNSLKSFDRTRERRNSRFAFAIRGGSLTTQPSGMRDQRPEPREGPDTGRHSINRPFGRPPDVPTTHLSKEVLPRGLKFYRCTDADGAVDASASETGRKVCYLSYRPGLTGRPLQTLMILPQVHLRKPCYDFYFL